MQKMVKEDYVKRMVDKLPVMRVSIGLTQAQLGAKLDVSRQTIVAIENKKRELSWSMYLSLICVFVQFEDARTLLETLNLYSPEYIRDA